MMSLTLPTARDIIMPLSEMKKVRLIEYMSLPQAAQLEIAWIHIFSSYIVSPDSLSSSGDSSAQGRMHRLES